jgi:hypothetical protein
VGKAFVPDFQPFSADQTRRLGTASFAAVGERPAETTCTCFVHAECNLAAQLLAEATAARGGIDIGVSRYTCWLCTLFLAELARAADMPIIISKHHSNVYQRWRFPPSLRRDIADAVKGAMRRKMLEEVTAIVATAMEKTASL